LSHIQWTIWLALIKDAKLREICINYQLNESRFTSLKSNLYPGSTQWTPETVLLLSTEVLLAILHVPVISPTSDVIVRQMTVNK